MAGLESALYVTPTKAALYEAFTEQSSHCGYGLNGPFKSQVAGPRQCDSVTPIPHGFGRCGLYVQG